MTLAVRATNRALDLDFSIQLTRRALPRAGFGVPASALADRPLAAWVRDRGVTVTAHDHDDLDVVQSNGIRCTQVVFRCGPETDVIRRAADLGVFRFVAGTSHQIARLRECAPRTEYVYLDVDSPLVFADRRLRVIGLFSDVDDAGGPVEWASAAERLLCRTALLKTCGSPVGRIMLSGGSTEAWLDGHAPRLVSVVTAVDDALREGCERWHLPRPTVTLAPVPTEK